MTHRYGVSVGARAAFWLGTLGMVGFGLALLLGPGQPLSSRIFAVVFTPAMATLLYRVGLRPNISVDERLREVVVTSPFEQRTFKFEDIAKARPGTRLTLELKTGQSVLVFAVNNSNLTATQGARTARVADQINQLLEAAE